MDFLKRRWRSFVISLINAFLCGTHFFKLKRFMLCCCDITVGKGTKIVGPFSVGNCSHITIGNDCWIGKSFSVHGDGTLEIGDNCDIAPEVSVFTGTHMIGNASRRADKGMSLSVKIGNGCWICGRASILGSIVIGNGAVVGMSSLVNKDIAENILVAGVPAKKIRELKNDNFDSYATLGL